MNKRLLLLVLTLAVLGTCSGDDHDDHDDEDKDLLSTDQRWGLGVLSGFGLATIGFTAALVVCCLNRCMEMPTFKVLIGCLNALACGALLGDTIVHNIPHGLENSGVNSKLFGLAFLAAVVFFLVLERAFAACGLSHSHSLLDEDTQIKSNKVANGQGEDSLVATKQGAVEGESAIVPANSSGAVLEGGDVGEGSKDEESKRDGCMGRFKNKHSSGWLNLLSSFMCNFQDGFALGIAFAGGERPVIIGILVAIIAHEVPREMGDVGMMMKAGFVGWEVVLCNGAINCISILGVIVGLGAGSAGEVTQLYLLAWVGGNFVYLAAEIWRQLLRHKNSFCKNFLEVIFLFVGIGIMYLITLIDDGHDDHDH